MMIKRLLMVVLMLSAGLVQAESCKRPEMLRYAVIPKQSQQLQYEAFEPMRLHLEQALGIPVLTVAAHSYQAVIEGIVSGAVDFAEMGPASYLKARNRDPGVMAIATYRFASGTFTPEGSYYNSLLLVNSSSDYETPADLRGKAIALTDPDSTSGSIIPNTRFVDETGFELDKLASHLVYAGSHDQALKVLLAGKVDAAFVASLEADQFLERGLAKAGQWRELWRSPPIYYDPMVVSSHLCPDLAEIIRQALMSPSQARDQLLAHRRALDIVAVSDEDYQWLEKLVLP